MSQLFWQNDFGQASVRLKQESKFTRRHIARWRPMKFDHGERQQPRFISSFLLHRVKRSKSISDHHFEGLKVIFRAMDDESTSILPTPSLRLSLRIYASIETENGKCHFRLYDCPYAAEAVCLTIIECRFLDSFDVDGTATGHRHGRNPTFV
jgi:hypothetical protein